LVNGFIVNQHRNPKSWLSNSGQPNCHHSCDSATATFDPECVKTQVI